MLSSAAMISLAVLILSTKPFAIYLMKIEMHVNKYVSQQESRHPTRRHTYSRLSGRGKGCIGIESWAHPFGLPDPGYSWFTPVKGTERESESSLKIHS